MKTIKNIKETCFPDKGEMGNGYIFNTEKIFWVNIFVCIKKIYKEQFEKTIQKIFLIEN